MTCPQRTFAAVCVLELMYHAMPCCAVLCCDMCSGDPIPRVDYTPQEVEVWGTALSHLKAMYPNYACKEFNTNLEKIGFR